MNVEEKSYIYGLLGADGSLYLNTRNRGRISLEVNEKDKDIVYKLCNIIPSSCWDTRTRDTNFKKSSTTYTFSNYQREFRDMLIDYGYPIENKKENFTTPNGEYSEADFWRGVIDGDGSIGITTNNEPYLSLVIVGESLKEEYLNFLNSHFNIIKNINRNKRDNVYNPILKNEDAIIVLKYLYDKAELYINRKYNNYLNVLSWKRDKVKINSRSWDEHEIMFIQNHTVEESCEYLNRSKSSIESKLHRLKNSSNKN